MRRSLWLLPVLLLLLTGCSRRYYETPQPALIVLKSPKLRYADMGFLYRGENRIKIQIYTAGRPVFTLSVGERICLDGSCMSEAEFYRKFFGVAYPPGTLHAIFSKRAIFGGEGLLKKKGRSEQQIFEPGRFDIIYTFDATSARFRDRINHIVIKISER
ncbi:hypothetical protein [Hydrogenimonas sp.]